MSLFSDCVVKLPLNIPRMTNPLAPSGIMAMFVAFARYTELYYYAIF